MPRNRRVKSVKTELVKKAREAMLAAVQIYNNPQVTFKAESFITLAVIGWTYLLHAYYRSIGVDYRYYRYAGKKKIYDKTKYGAYKHWELERCLNENDCPLDGDTITNLKFLIGVRHEIEHQMTDKVDEFLSAKLQACALNFDFYICKLFGDKYNLSKELSLAIQFSPLTLEQRDTLHENSHITSNVRNFVVAFEDVLSEEALASSRYAYRVLFVPINAKRKGQADQVVEFIKSDSPLAEGIEKTWHEKQLSDHRLCLSAVRISTSRCAQPYADSYNHGAEWRGQAKHFSFLLPFPQRLLWWLPEYPQSSSADF